MQVFLFFIRFVLFFNVFPLLIGRKSQKWDEKRQLRYRVIAAAAPGMATQESADGEVEAFEGAVFAEGFEGVLGTGRGEAAAGLLERGDADLVETYQEDEGRCRSLFDCWNESVLLLCHGGWLQDSGSSPE